MKGFEGIKSLSRQTIRKFFNFSFWNQRNN